MQEQLYAPLPLFTVVSHCPFHRIRIVRLCSTYERFPPMGTHFKLRSRHLGVRASLISADNKGKQKPMPPAYNVGVLPPATTCPACPAILFGGKRCNSSAVEASAAHASPEHISSRIAEALSSRMRIRAVWGNGKTLGNFKSAENLDQLFEICMQAAKWWLIDDDFDLHRIHLMSWMKLANLQFQFQWLRGKFVEL